MTTTKEANESSTRDVAREFGKDAATIIYEREPFNSSPPLAMLRHSFITPTPLFYVRNHAPVPQLEAETFKLSIEGEVERSLQISLAELKERFPSHTVTATLQCAGNRRDGMMRVAVIKGEVPWGAEALGTARWMGVRLADVLRYVGIRADGRHVQFLGADRVEKAGEVIGFGGSVPIEKAFGDEVLLAYEMNGESLTPVHGAPLRVVVPGYIGARSVKWLEQISVAPAPSPNYYQQKTYKVFPSHVTAANAHESEGIMLGALSINSCICSPGDGATIDAGRVQLEGYATAGGERVARVEVSRDAGKTWQVARLHEDGEQAEGEKIDSRWAWRFWTAELDLAAGNHKLVARAWDSAANTQPARAEEIWNFKGYMNNAWHEITIQVYG